jgi:hypothetical protein
VLRKALINKNRLDKGATLDALSERPPATQGGSSAGGSEQCLDAGVEVMLELERMEEAASGLVVVLTVAELKGRFPRIDRRARSIRNRLCGENWPVLAKGVERAVKFALVLLNSAHALKVISEWADRFTAN